MGGGGGGGLLFLNPGDQYSSIRAMAEVNQMKIKCFFRVFCFCFFVFCDIVCVCLCVGVVWGVQSTINTSNEKFLNDYVLCVCVCVCVCVCWGSGWSTINTANEKFLTNYQHGIS